MNESKLRAAEKQFLRQYPGGFRHPEMQAIGKKHKMDQMVAFAQEHFAKSRFSDADAIAHDFAKLIGRSSVISVFEKPRLRDAIATLDRPGTQVLAGALRKQLHGNQQKGFEELVDFLGHFKLAKWSLVTVLPNYYRPDEEVFLKPTTVKGVIAQFGLKGLKYKPKPTWEFYAAYRDEILKMKSMVDPALTSSNAAFCGFLMMRLRA